MLRSRTNRYYGHPNTIDFVESLALKANQKLKTTLLIGDLSLPRGGRFSSGHSSHQTGLDIDIWLRLADSPLSYNELQLPKPMSVVDLQDYSILNHRWDKRHLNSSVMLLRAMRWLVSLFTLLSRSNCVLRKGKRSFLAT